MCLISTFHSDENIQFYSNFLCFVLKLLLAKKEEVGVYMVKFSCRLTISSAIYCQVLEP